MPTTTPTPTPGRNPGMRDKRDHHFFSPQDSALSNQIEGTHVPDFEDLQVMPLLSIVEDILHLPNPRGIAEIILLHKLEDMDVYSQLDPQAVKVLAYPIKISYEIICKCATGGESDSVAMDLLRSLSSYSWDAKVAITFAAFAINYGEFWPVEAGEEPKLKGYKWLVEHFDTKDPPTKIMGILKDLPDIMATANHELKKKFDAVLDLLKSAMQVAHCIIAFKELSPMYISRESPEITAAMGNIPTAVYWIIRSLLVCSCTLSMIGTTIKYITPTAESWEILSSNHKVQVIMDHMQCQLRFCKHLVDRKNPDVSESLVRIMESSHMDNTKVLRKMIRWKENGKPLFDGSKRTNEPLESLRMKYVLLLISDIDLPWEELTVLRLIYQNRGVHEYEILWLPIMDQSYTNFQDKVFYELRNIHMPWFSIDHPSLVEPVAIRYIREVWKFTHTPMLVVLDPRGKPLNLDALPMMCIWGSTALPFTKAREIGLWSESNWNIELLANAIDPRFIDWIKDEKVICLYGGEDIEWIQSFTLATRSLSRDLNVNMEMLYVGKCYPTDKVRRCHEIIVTDNLSHVFSVTEYDDYMLYFWVRLMSMLNSKNAIGCRKEDDKIMREIEELLIFDSSNQGWAVFSRGNYEIFKVNGEKLLPVLDKSGTWGSMVDVPSKFVTVLHKQLHHCNRLILPGNAGHIPGKVVCTECGEEMEKYVMFRCCTDSDGEDKV